MPVTPADPQTPVEDAGKHSFRWYHKLVGLLFVILCFEIGIFLVAFPWSSYWTANYFSALSPEWSQIWGSPYVRGGVSGIGIVNLYVSLLEVFRLQRFSTDPE